MERHILRGDKLGYYSLFLVYVIGTVACEKTRATSVTAPALAPSALAPNSANAIATSPQVGRIVCGNQTCLTGMEVCCRGEPPNEDKSACIPVKPGQLENFGSLQELCNARGTLLVACDESRSCGSGRACCEIVWGSGQPQPIVCTEPRPDESYPCDFWESCVPGVPCVTPGARCVAGHCIIPSPKAPIQCDPVTCASKDEVCCLRRESNHLECETTTNCQAPDAQYHCTNPSDCSAGEFCGVTYGGSGCLHSNDGMTEILCNSAADCPPSVRKQCQGLGQTVQCSATDSDSAMLRGRKTCQCQSE